MVSCEKYSKSLQADWDQFVRSSRTPLFMFERTFIEYHSDRFEDCSLVLKDEKGIIALLPANKVNDELISHGGITYGGLIFGKKFSAEKMLDAVDIMLKTIKGWGIRSLTYKTTPYVFHDQPCDEAIYALSRHGAHLCRRDLSSVIVMGDRLGYSTLRKRQIKKAHSFNIKVSSSEDYSSFHALVTASLLRHGTKPVHSIEELKYLKYNFPNNIELKVAKKDDVIHAALLLFIFDNVVHTQYISVSSDGGSFGALDLLMAETIDKFQSLNFKFFSFGISTERNGELLNNGLIHQKEGFGGRGMAFDAYRIELHD